jgi:hypothetical protein
MQQRPVNALIALAFAFLPWPAMKLAGAFGRPCGDGLCGFASGLLILGSLAAATLVFVVRSARRREVPAVLRALAIALWPLGLVPLVL